MAFMEYSRNANSLHHTNESAFNPFSKPNNYHELSPFPNIDFNNWKSSVAPNLRFHLAQKLTENMIPLHEDTTEKEKKMNGRNEYGRYLENKIFASAEDHNDYLQKIAEKIHFIQKTREYQRISSIEANQSEWIHNPRIKIGPERTRQIQGQLVLLLHAHKCLQKDNENLENGNVENNCCSLTHCSTMKNVIFHMTLCDKGKDCRYNHCASSRQILSHWKDCDGNCKCCWPLKSVPKTVIPIEKYLGNNLTSFQ